MTVMLPGQVEQTEQTLEWGNEVLRVAIAHGPSTPPRLLALWHVQEPAPDLAALRPAALPVLEVSEVGSGRAGTSGKRHVDGALAQRLRLTDQQESQEGGLRRLHLQLADDRTGLAATVHLELADGLPVLRSWARLTAPGELVLEHATTCPVSGLGHGARWEDELAVWEAANPWSGEFRWRVSPLAERGLYDVGMHRFGQVGSKNRISLTSTGAWSTSEHLPMGIVEDRRTGRMLAWQIASNTGWHAELGDRYGDVYLAVSGPTGAEHGWSARLGGGRSFSTVPVDHAVAPGGAQQEVLAQVAAALTDHRRRIRRPHPDNAEPAIVYNDFLNALMSDPTTERVLPLVEAAADLGVDTYVMDAGWYDDEDGGWWDSVGAWQPSTTRFPGGGLSALLDQVAARGLRVGLWLEPEVVGERSPMAASLPAEAFFQRAGTRVAEWGRFQLDLRHHAARTHLDAVVDRLVGGFDLDYLKLDYNVDTLQGTDGGAAQAPGAGLLGHGRAFLDWVGDVLDRHPGLVVEGCAAGGSRTDAASGAVFPVQSLTDQQDFRLMPPIVAAAPLAITPEQSGIWASVDGTMSDEELAFSMTTALLGRVHLAGRIDTLTEPQRAIVRRALTVHRGLRGAVTGGVPIWPWGLPGWRDERVCQGLRHGRDLYLLVWQRAADPDADRSPVRIPLPGCRAAGEVRVLYPDWAEGEACVVDDGQAVQLTAPAGLAARLLALTVQED